MSISIKEAIRFALAPVSVCMCLTTQVQAQSTTATPIQHVVVIFPENESFDHYFGTYPNAQNLPGEAPFSAVPGTPTVNGFGPELLLTNPNMNSAGTRINPARFPPSEAYTCSQNHAYGPEQAAVDGGLLDKFPTFTAGSGNGCATDGSTVMAYYDGNTVAALWNYAQNYALNDNSFGTTFGPSTPGAINLVSGQTYGGLTHFGSGNTNTYPNTVSVSPAGGGAGTGTVVTDIGDDDPYLDDCGSDKGGTVTTSTTLEMNSDASAQTGHKNIGDLLNAAGVTWGWFGGGFRPTVAASNGAPAICGTARIGHEWPSSTPSANASFVVPNPAIHNTADIHTNVSDYSAHHSPFMYYASTRNVHHLPPTATVIGTQDQANHQYDTLDFVTALNSSAGIPAVSFIKPPSAYDAHPGNSDPLSEQYFITQIVNAIMQSSAWPSTAIIIAYDDSDGWYDHVTGPIVSPSAVTISGLASSYDNLAGVGNCGTPASGAQPARCGHGPRLPLLVISPYANTNYVDHTLTDQTSVINFIEMNWGLGFLDGPTAPPAGQAAFDRFAGPLTGMFNFSAPPNIAPVLLTCAGQYANSVAQPCQLDPRP